MSLIRPSHTLLVVLLYILWDTTALKCRTGEESQPSDDFEYVVRMCLRQMRNNASRHDNRDRNFQSMFDADKNRRDRNNNNNNNRMYNFNNNRKDYGGQGNRDEHFWGAGRDRDRRREGERDSMESDYGGGDDDGGFDYFHVNPFRQNDRTRIRPMSPHSYRQQMQHDRDGPFFGYGHRDTPPYSMFQSGDRNKGSYKKGSNLERKGESPLDQLDPCMIHCIFQEMQMLDESGKPEKGIVAEKMSQKIRNPELKAFIQDSVEECFDMVDEDSGRSRGKGIDFMCVWAKNFAICLEDKGKESCDDWNEPLQRNTSSKEDQQKNKNKGGKGGNNNNNNSNNNNNNNNNSNNNRG